MSLVKYTRSIATHLPNGLDVARLKIELQNDSNISIALDYIDVAGDAVDIYYRAALTTPEETALDIHLSLHSGLPLPDAKNSEGIPLVAIHGTDNHVQMVGRVGSEMTRVTHNFCDPCTWFGDSQRVNSEILSNSGDGLTWESVNSNWIDMTHGRVHGEGRYREEEGTHGYHVIVRVNGVAQTPRPIRASDWSLGGDYYVDYETGRVIFQNPPAQAPMVEYSYATTSSWYLTPAAGKKIQIENAEVQWSNVTYNCTIVQEVQVEVAPGVWVGPEVFAPTEMAKYRGLTKTFDQLVDEARRAFPATDPVVGAPANKGTGGHKTEHFPLVYTAVKRIQSSENTRLKFYVAHLAYGPLGEETVTNLTAADGGLIGRRATATFYAVSLDE